MKKEPENPLLEHLKKAVEDLETVAGHTAEDLPNIHNIDVKEQHLVPKNTSTIRQTFDLISSLFPKIHDEMARKRIEIKKELLHSIEFLKKHYRLIHKLKAGSRQEKALADRTIQTIEKYNELIRQSRKDPETLGARLSHFVYEQTGLSLIDEEMKKILIDLPIIGTSESYSTETEEEVLERTASKLAQGEIVELTKIESDMFYMRGFSLAKGNLPQALSSEIVTMMRKKPINTIVEKGDEEKKSSTIISMEQQLTPFPGEYITVKGAIERNAQSAVPSVPIPKSFRISTVVTQTGFPHPSQHTGWALANELIPDHPIRTDLIPLFYQLYREKLEIARKLLPKGPLNKKAKSLLQMKKKAFAEKFEELLPLHEQLSLAVIESANFEELEMARVKRVVEKFYRDLADHRSPFEYLTQTFHLINRSFIEIPYQVLYHQWQEHQTEELFSEDFKTRGAASQEILRNEILKTGEELTRQIIQPHKEIDSDALSFVLIFGQVVGAGVKSILLMHFSEKVVFPPPLLTEFEEKIQSAALLHLSAFHRELKEDLPVSHAQVVEKMKESLEKEILLFSSDLHESSVPALKITHELERYYSGRYAYYLKSNP